MSKTLKGLLTLGACIALAACAQSSVMQLDANTAAVTVSAAPVCGVTGAQRVAYEDAAIETLRLGYDRFIIEGVRGQDRLSGVLFTPVTASSFGSTETVTGGDPLFLFHHRQQIVVKMFHSSDPMASRAVSARGVLGPHWRKRLASGMPSTC